MHVNPTLFAKLKSPLEDGGGRKAGEGSAESGTGPKTTLHTSIKASARGEAGGGGEKRVGGSAESGRGMILIRDGTQLCARAPQQPKEIP